MRIHFVRADASGPRHKPIVIPANRIPSRPFLRAVLILSWMIQTISAHAATWFVRPDGSTESDGRSWAAALAHPSAAAALAEAGDQIWVAQGRYKGAEILLPPGVQLMGGFVGNESSADARGLDPTWTVLEAAANRPVITISGQGNPTTTLISGLQLVPASGLATTGLGINATNAVVVVRHCWLEGFRAMAEPRAGSALRMRQGSLTVENSVFRRNSVSSNGGYGAAIGGESVSPLLVRSNVFLGNFGGNATCMALIESVGEVTDNQFVGNEAFPGQSSMAGAMVGAVELRRSGIALLRNRFLFNRWGSASAVLVFDQFQGLTNRIEFNLMAGGLAAEVIRGFPFGSVSVAGTGIARVVNNTFVGNTELPQTVSLPNGPVAATTPGAVALFNNLFIGHAGGQTYAEWPNASRNLCLDIDSPAYRDLQSLGVTGGMAHRELVGGLAGFTFHLTPDALSRGFGDPSAVLPGSTDAAGRPVPHPDGSVDVGAFAFTSEVTPVSPRILHLRPDGNDAASGESWAEALQTLSAAATRVDLSRPTEVWLAGGTYVGLPGTNGFPPNLTFRGGFAGTEQSPSERPAAGTVKSRVIRNNTQSAVRLFGNGPWNELDRLELDLAGSDPRQTLGCLGHFSWPWIHHCSFVGLPISTNCVALRLDGGIVEDCSFTGFTTTGALPAMRVVVIFKLGPVAVFQRNRIENNHASGSGAALAAFAPTAVVSHNLWLSNSISGNNSALVTTSLPTNGFPTLRLTHNTFIGNLATDTSKPSGTLIAPLTPTIPIEFHANLVAFNRGVIQLSRTDAAAARDNLLHDNGDVVPTHPLNPESNLAIDPGLAPGAWRLPVGSPAIDAVRSPGPEAFARDIDGEGAWLGRFPDIGADESLPALPQADSIAAATLTGPWIPGSSQVIWRASESACDDCIDRIWVDSGNTAELRLVPRLACNTIGCLDPNLLRARAFDLAPDTSGIGRVTVTFDGAPARTLGVWLPPSLQGRLHVAQINDVPQVTRESHPAALTEVFASPDLLDWQLIPQGNVGGFIAGRLLEGSWFFRSAAR
jgi:hypothetical protein